VNGQTEEKIEKSHEIGFAAVAKANTLRDFISPLGVGAEEYFA